MNLSFLEPVIQLDRRLTILLHNLFPHNAFFDALFSFFSFYGFSIAIWAIIFTALVIFEEQKRKTFVWFLLGSIVSTYVVVEYVLKNLYGRARPVRFYENFLTLCPSGFSFPSGHAAVSFAAATIFSYFDKERRIYYYILAFFISLSRIYLGCHYLVDIAGGAIVGILISQIILSLFNKKAK